MPLRSSHASRCDAATGALQDVDPISFEGHVISFTSRGVEATGLLNSVAIGDRIELFPFDKRAICAEVVAVNESHVTAIPFEPPKGITYGSSVIAKRSGRAASLGVCDEWIGRVVDPLGRPLDSLGPLPLGMLRSPIHARPPEATHRARLGGQLDLGIKVLNLFTPCCHGQRLGLFAASGGGKSTLMAMLARNVKSDVAVLALVGERGKEVREFLEDALKQEGMARSVVVVATSDSGALMRREAAYSAITIAEYFRDRGKAVLLLIDSVTRFCLALREIALAAGEPPAMRGYPASVFGELPKLLERAGPASETTPGRGSISAFFTVLVEGDDHDEPISDAVRGFLDGHIVLRRQIAEAGRYPAVDVIRSLSRNSSRCYDAGQSQLVQRARGVITTHAESVDLIRLGAYRSGSDPKLDEAVSLMPQLNCLLRQDQNSKFSIAESFAGLALVMGQVSQ